MARAGALALLLLAAFVAHQAGAEDAQASRSTAFALGLALIAAALAGEAAARVRLPRLSGYLLFGLAAGPYAANLITRPMARELTVLNDLAIALIAFVAGLELNLARLRPRLRAILALGLTTMALMFVVLVGTLWAAWPWLPIAPEASPLVRFAMATVTATLIVSFSPTVSIAVIAESRARGPLSELVMTVVVLSDLVLILLFALVLQFVRTASGVGADDIGLLPHLSWEIVGSLAVGAIVGALLAFYLKWIGREVTLVLLAVCGAISAAAHAWHLELVLTALAAGLVLENIASTRGDDLKHAIEAGSLPVLIVFFAAAGASLQLDALAGIGGLALGLAALRLALIRGGAAVGSRIARLPPDLGGTVWMGLVSQAGVTLGLASIVAAEHPTWGTQVQTLVIALTGLHVLAGPVLFRAALARAGEVGAAAPEPREATSG